MFTYSRHSGNKKLRYYICINLSLSAAKAPSIDEDRWNIETAYTSLIKNSDLKTTGCVVKGLLNDLFSLILVWMGFCLWQNLKVWGRMMSVKTPVELVNQINISGIVDLIKDQEIRLLDMNRGELYNENSIDCRSPTSVH